MRFWLRRVKGCAAMAAPFQMPRTHENDGKLSDLDQTIRVTICRIIADSQGYPTKASAEVDVHSET